MKWINTTNLRNWALTRNCQDQLPLLIRKLIRATSNSIKSISFPSGDNVLIGGWDGILEVYEETVYLPLGTSLWEFGTTADVKGKADDDYEKRKTNTLGFKPDESVFIFVTPRLWTKKDDWITARKQENYFKDVRVYDAQDLEEWIDSAPSVGAWLAVKHLNLFPQGVQSADDFWDEWSTGNKTTFVPEVVLAGRLPQVEQLFSLSVQPAIIPIKGSSREEAIAFTIASFKQNKELSEDFFARALIVDSPNAFRETMVVDKPLFLIVRFEDDNVINRARSNGHVVYVPLGIDNTGQWQDRVELPPLEREAFVEALVTCGLSREDSEKTSKRSARNLSVLRRQLEFNRTIPEWAIPGNVRDLIPAMIAERWDESRPEDKKIIEKLAGEDYESYISKLKQWCYTADAPIVKIGSKWRLTSPLDAWTHAGKYCTKADFEHLQVTFYQAFDLSDPRLELKPEERHLASLYGVQRNYSAWIREGLVQTLILISVYGEKIALDLPISPEQWVDNIIAKLLATESPDIWKSLDHDMPLLAEASPYSFIARLENLLKTENSPIYQLFEEASGFLHSHAYHTGLLWALENVAWIPEYLTRASSVLARLVEIDPGGKLVNRPVNSLREIFKSWHPQTLSPLNGRIAALRLMIQNHKTVAHTILYSMLPSRHGIANPTNRMRWRLSEETFPHGTTYEEIYQTHSQVIVLIMQIFESNEDNFKDLLEKSFELSPIDREKTLDFLEDKRTDINHIENKSWHSLRKIIARHRTYPQANWSLKEVELTRYQNLYDLLTPQDPVEQRLWMLAEDWPEPMGGDLRKIPFEQRHEKIQKIRIETLRFIYENHHLDKIFEVLDILPKTRTKNLAFTAADVIESNEDLARIYNFLNDKDKRLEFAQHFIAKKSHNLGKGYVFSLYQQLKEEGFQYRALTNLFLKLNADRELWDFIDQTNEEIIKQYWKEVDTFYFYLCLDDRIYGINQLMNYQRFSSAFNQATSEADKLETELLVKVLTDFIQNPPEKEVSFDSYEIQYIFDELRSREITDQDTMIKLEWLYLPVLGRGFDAGNTPILHKEMAENPDFFMQVVSQVYNPETVVKEVTETSEEATQQKAQVAQYAYQLLNTWKIVPGTDCDGNIDEQKLKNWVATVIENAKSEDRLIAVESQLGSILAQIPETNTKMDPDKELNWPPDVVCQLIESMDSEYLYSNFRSGIYNKRSFSSRGAFDDGQREWHISKYFKTLSNLKAANFPRIAAIFQDLSKDYEQEAKKEDERATRDRLDY